VCVRVVVCVCEGWWCVRGGGECVRGGVVSVWRCVPPSLSSVVGNVMLTRCNVVSSDVMM
jgi:hypothetical protein